MKHFTLRLVVTQSKLIEMAPLRILQVYLQEYEIWVMLQGRIKQFKVLQKQKPVDRMDIETIICTVTNCKSREKQKKGG